MIPFQYKQVSRYLKKNFLQFVEDILIIYHSFVKQLLWDHLTKFGLKTDFSHQIV